MYLTDSTSGSTTPMRDWADLGLSSMLLGGVRTSRGRLEEDVRGFLVGFFRGEEGEPREGWLSKVSGGGTF